MQKASDFMDDEDLGNFGFAPQGLKASDQFRQPQQKQEKGERDRKRKLEDSTSGPIPGDPVLEQIIKPSSDTVGKFYKFI